jgi:glycosyltransferase involved in cell wall biosynthesis
MKLTIGMATYDDYDGVYFSIMSALHMHRHMNPEFVVVDDNPRGKHGSENVAFCDKVNAKYIPTDKPLGSAGAKNQVFRHASDGIVICIDSHVQIQDGGVDAIVDTLMAESDMPVLVQGPLLYESWFLAEPAEQWKHCATHWNDTWSNGMQGQWQRDDRVQRHEPFEIPVQGMGMFACIKAWWPGFSPFFSGFGGEEGYIHEKFRRMGGKVLCDPAAGWSHRFHRVGGQKYHNSLDQRCLNYLIGKLENRLPIDGAVEHFRDKLPNGRVDALVEQAYNVMKGTVIQ